MIYCCRTWLWVTTSFKPLPRMIRERPPQTALRITVEVDVTPPAAPTGLFATADYGWVSLDWADNSEHDLAGYNIYRSTVPGSYGAALTNVTESGYYDLGLVGGTHILLQGHRHGYQRFRVGRQQRGVGHSENGAAGHDPVRLQ